MEYSTSKQGNPQIIFNHKKYRKLSTWVNENGENTEKWVCSTEKTCKGQINVRNGEMISDQSNRHTCNVHVDDTTRRIEEFRVSIL